MRKWGLIITLFYLAVLVVLLTPALLFLPGNARRVSSYDLRALYRNWYTWMYVGFFVAAQALLMLLTVDTSRRRMRPRAHIFVSATTTGLMLAILTFSAVVSAAMVIRSAALASGFTFVGTFFVSWIGWGIIFYRLTHNIDDAVTRAVSWLLRGSVLELLIAVPSHVLARRRQDCSAPVLTGYGICTGIAIMLLSFGPSVLLLYKKRMDGLKSKGAAATN